MTQAGDRFDTWQDRYEFPAHARRATLVFSEPNEMRMGAYQFTVRLRRRGMRTRTWSCAGTPSGLDPWSFDDRFVAFACWAPEYDGWWLERCAISGQILDATSGRVMHSVDLEEHLPELPRATGPGRGYIVDLGPGLRGDEGLLKGWWHATYDPEGDRLRLGYYRQEVPGTPLLTEYVECRVDDM